jgi:inner membrane protein
MQYYSHVTAAVATTVALAPQFHQPITIALMAGVVIGSLFPDIDEPKSNIGQKAPGVSHLIHFLFGHRGLTHSILFIALMFLPFFYHPIPLLYGFFIGVVLHILCDACSVSGVPLLLPFSKQRFGIPLYITGGIREYIILLGFLGLLCWKINSQFHFIA